MHHVMVTSDTHTTAHEVRAVLALQNAPAEGGLERNIISVLSGVCSGVSSASVIAGCINE